MDLVFRQEDLRYPACQNLKHSAQVNDDVQVELDSSIQLRPVMHRCTLRLLENHEDLAGVIAE